MSPKDPTERQRQPGQSDEASEQLQGSGRAVRDQRPNQGQDSPSTRQQNQQYLNETGSDEDTEVDSLEDEDDGGEEGELEDTDEDRIE